MRTITSALPTAITAPWRRPGLASVFFFLVFLCGAALSVFVDNDLGLKGTAELVLQLDPIGYDDSFDAFFFAYGTLPRLAAAVFGGMILGLVGSLLQQITLNPLASPLTLGTSAGAWLAIAAASAFFPELAADGLVLLAFAGALVAFGLIILIAGPRGMSGLSIIIAGMVVNLLFGAAASAIVLLKSDFISNVFLWGAGDLAQNGWTELAWLAPRAAPCAVLLLLFGPRALALLSLGADSAKARGLATGPAFLLLTVLAVWMASAFTAMAGVISFIGLIAPNAARAAGWRAPRPQLIASMLIGASLLTAADGAAALLSSLTSSIVPTGVAAAAAGTPVFIALALKGFSSRKALAEDVQSEDAGTLRTAPKRFTLSRAAFLLLLLSAAAALSCFTIQTPDGWSFAPAGAMTLSLRLPRFVSAAAAGAALAAAGVILQRLVRNPLASPDILGVTAGASLCMICGALFFGSGIGFFSARWAILGSLASLAAILILSRRTHYSPGAVVLLGIAFSAFLDAMTALLLSQSTMANYYILQWLSGSTYKSSAASAAGLALAAASLIALAFAASRSATLLGIGRDFAQSRGLPVNRSTAALFALCAALCAASTAAVGPIAFVGLVAPHAAKLLGASTIKAQLTASVLTGSSLVAWSDLMGQLIVSPVQIPAGTLSSIFGASYLLFLLIRQRWRRSAP